MFLEIFNASLSVHLSESRNKNALSNLYSETPSSFISLILNLRRTVKMRKLVVSHHKNRSMKAKQNIGKFNPTIHEVSIQDQVDFISGM